MKLSDRPYRFALSLAARTKGAQTAEWVSPSLAEPTMARIGAVQGFRAADPSDAAVLQAEKMANPH
jgi:hypothetical protein